MNIRIDYYDDQNLSHGDKGPVQAKRVRPDAARRSTNSARRGKTPAQQSGMHRRRRKRIAW